MLITSLPPTRIPHHASAALIDENFHLTVFTVDKVFRLFVSKNIFGVDQEAKSRLAGCMGSVGSPSHLIDGTRVNSISGDDYVTFMNATVC